MENSVQNAESGTDNFLVQATILAAAGLVSRIIGLLYRSPLAAVIGDLGSGYYQAAYNIYTIVLLISSYSIPSAISKVIAQKLGVGEYRNAHRIFLCSLGYVIVIGGLASLFLFFGAGFLVDGNAVMVLRLFAPTIFLYGLLGVLRGYFQAHKSMTQTSVSQILEQIANAVVSIGAAVLLIQVYVSGVGASIIINEDPGFAPAVYGMVFGASGIKYATYETERAMYGAMGSAMGTGAGVLVGLIFMFAMYLRNRGAIQKRVKNDSSGALDSYGNIIRSITSVVTPFILSTAAYNLSTALNSVIYLRISRIAMAMDEATAYSNYGIFAYKAVTISNIPVAFASAMASAMIPVVSQLMARGDREGTRDRVGTGIRTTMLISIPSAVGLFVLARPITWLLFPQPASVELAANLLRALSVTVILFSLSTLSSNILQGIGKVRAPIYHAVISLSVQSVILVSLLMFTDLNLYALAIANIVYSGLMCILNQWSVRKTLGYRQEIRKTFVLPAAAAAIMGVTAWFSYEGLYILTSSNALSVIPAIVVAICVYFVVLIKMGGMDEKDLRSIPKGYMLVKVAKKCHLM